MRNGAVTGLALLTLLLGTIAGTACGYFLGNRQAAPPVGTSASAQEIRELTARLDDPSKRFVATAATVRPAVVHVKVYRKDWWSERRREQGNGSGVIVSPQGRVLTNHHVVNGAERIGVVLQDGRQLDAAVVGSDPNTDIAVLQVNTNETLPSVELGDSDSLEVGQWVLAIGNPFGIGQTVTAGIISARGRAGVGIANAEDFLQTDAAINPGNSGGPMVDLSGRVVGINSAIITRSGGYQGIGLAVPINIAKAIMDSLDKTGKIYRGYLGVRIETVEFTQGPLTGRKAVRVSSIETGSPALAAGLKQGDIILSYGGTPVRGVRHLLGRIASGSPGQTMELEVLRGRSRELIKVELGRREVGGR